MQDNIAISPVIVQFWASASTSGPEAGGSSYDFILKVGGSSMWNEPMMTWLPNGAKLMIVLSTLFQFVADLHSFSRIWNLELTARRNLTGNSFWGHSFALKNNL